jgi:hypothetical protein
VLIKLSNGQTWCRFHLPMTVEGQETAKAHWGEAEIEAFNDDIFACIDTAARCCSIVLRNTAIVCSCASTVCSAALAIVTRLSKYSDPSDPHRLRAAIQILSQPHQIGTGVRSNEWRSGPIWQENVWGNAVHRVAAEGISPEQAVDEAIARIKEILSE